MIIKIIATILILIIMAIVKCDKKPLVRCSLCGKPYKLTMIVPYNAPAYKCWIHENCPVMLEKI